MPGGMTMASRLALGFGGLLFVLSLAVGVGLNGMNGLHAIIQRTVIDDWQRAVLANRAIELMNVQARDTLTLFQASKREPLRTRIATRTHTITGVLDELERSLVDPRSKELLAEARFRRRLYVASFSHVVDLLDAGERQEASGRMIRETLPALDAAIAEMNRLIEWQGEMLARTGGDSLRWLKTTREAVTLSLLAALFIALLLAAWILHAVVRPLGGEPDDVRRVVERIAAGDLGSEIRLRPGDGRSLLAAVKTMQHNLRALIEARSVADQALHASQVRFQEMVENLRDWVWEVDARGRYTYASPQVRDILGYAPEELVGRGQFELAAPEEAGAARALFQSDCALREPMVAVETVYLHRDGHRVVLERSGKPFCDEHGRFAGYRGVDREITDRREAEAQRLAEQVRLRDALVREVHHRIKNNLQTVVGLLRREAGKRPEAAAVIDAAIAQVQAVAIVHGLYGLAVRHSVPLSELLTTLVGSVRDLTGARIDESEGVRPGEGRLLIRESETVAVALILNELITNAAKHAAPGGDVPVLRVGLVCDGPRAHVRISNRGRLPATFDFDSRCCLGTGLGLVRVLLPVPGMSLHFRQAGDEVEVEAIIEPPVVGEAAQPAEAAPAPPAAEA